MSRRITKLKRTLHNLGYGEDSIASELKTRRRGRKLLPRVIITGKATDPNNPSWREKHLADPKKVRPCSGRHARSLRRLAAVKRSGIPASLWVRKSETHYERIA